jgi:hypothetical protein
VVRGLDLGLIHERGQPEGALEGASYASGKSYQLEVYESADRPSEKAKYGPIIWPYSDVFFAVS